VFLLPGVDRPYMKSLWSPAVRWTGVTEEGLDGGPVVPDDYDGSAQSLAVRLNVERSGEIGSWWRQLQVEHRAGAAAGQERRDRPALDYHALSQRIEACAPSTSRQVASTSPASPRWSAT
jgi:hypothetical protein